MRKVVQLEAAQERFCEAPSVLFDMTRPEFRTEGDTVSSRQSVRG